MKLPLPKFGPLKKRHATQTERPPGYDTMLPSRRLLPVHEWYNEILDVYHQSQIMILSGKTGLGKSTQVPQLLTYDEHPGGLQVACTQPRQLSTRESANREVVEMGRYNENNKKTRPAFFTLAACSRVRKIRKWLFVIGVW
ncbi:unnamed protein product [Clonostachys chloroleuca]|uniref:RNA helicase n=1 Tax=Clonostachys chloroleuca TaxID=1926264 RepID=A0AA35LRU0_9HYPO|nr:unnamed protein product [Clonostachys chloroleuca]